LWAIQSAVPSPDIENVTQIERTLSSWSEVKIRNPFSEKLKFLWLVIGKKMDFSGTTASGGKPKGCQAVLQYVLQ
jgi:hypothetical protein